MNILELALENEWEQCCSIINAGRNFQREQGFVQWTDSYPNAKTIQDDIQSLKGYVLKVDGVIAAYMCIDFDGEPAYANIKGEWHTNEPYAVIHRMAFSNRYRGFGLADIVFCLIDQLCIQNNVGNIRVDTDFPNKRMQHILEKNGYLNCGIIMFQGSDKLAYEKQIK